jgi:hypothetical protein
VKSASLVPLTFHDLRHTHVALLIRYGWPEYNIVWRLGWKDGTMLYRVYGHLQRRSGSSPRRGKQPRVWPMTWGFFGAGDRGRTGDLYLGKVALYQLSHARKTSSLLDGP